ncbi:MAG: hypothetical protein OXH83_11580 [Bryobacterales bacterium]|nr:hypothetical protein [Bryobacterales bacterium]
MARPTRSVCDEIDTVNFFLLVTYNGVAEVIPQVFNQFDGHAVPTGNEHRRDPPTAAVTGV